MPCRLIGLLLVAAGVASEACAGLQSAMATAVAGIQAAETRIAALRYSPRLPYYWDLGPAPDGTLYVDPVRSTTSEAVYIDGPRLTYDPSTGAASLFAPPMLGPADEFGVRAYHSPQSVTLLYGDSRVESPELPHLTSYSRSPHNLPPGGESFTATELGPSAYQLSLGDSHLVAYVPNNSEFGGFRLDFAKWLRPGLEASLFAVPEPPTPQPGELILMTASIGDPLPAIGAIVQYGYAVGLSTIYLEQETILAKVVVVPEPSTVAVCLTALGIAGVSRRR